MGFQVVPWHPTFPSTCTILEYLWAQCPRNAERWEGHCVRHSSAALVFFAHCKAVTPGAMPSQVMCWISVHLPLISVYSTFVAGLLDPPALRKSPYVLGCNMMKARHKDQMNRNETGVATTLSRLLAVLFPHDSQTKNGLQPDRLGYQTPCRLNLVPILHSTR